MRLEKEQNEQKVTGTVVEALPSALFKLKLKDVPAGQSSELVAYLAGKMRIHRIKVLVGDTVEVLLDPYGGRGRITKRL